MGTSVKRYTREEVGRHRSSDDLWIVLDNDVFDLSAFVFTHPGGEEVLLDQAGGDATECFDNVGHSLDAQKLRKSFKIGEVTEETPKGTYAATFDGEYGRHFSTPKSVLFDYVVPLTICAMAFLYFCVLSI